MRLTPIGWEIGLVSEERHEVYLRKRRQRDALIASLEDTKIAASPEVNTMLRALGSGEISGGVRAVELLRRPQVTLSDIASVSPAIRRSIESIDADLREETAEAAEILVKYEGYIRRERELADKAMRLENLLIPDGFDFLSLTALSTEARQKLDRIRPRNIGQASRIPGVSPADINILLVLLGR